MKFVAEYDKGLAEESVRISYRSLVTYRVAIMFWALRSHHERRLPGIGQGRLSRELTDAMCIAADSLIYQKLAS